MSSGFIIKVIPYNTSASLVDAAIYSIACGFNNTYEDVLRGVGKKGSREFICLFVFTAYNVLLPVERGFCDCSFHIVH